MHSATIRFIIKQKLRNAHIPTLFDNQKRFSGCTQMLLEYQQHIKLLKSGDYFFTFNQNIAAIFNKYFSSKHLL